MDRIIIDLKTGQQTVVPLTQDEIDDALVRTAAENTPEKITAIYEQALDNMLNSVAHAHRYNDRFTFAIRAAYPGPWQAEGLAFAQWMDTCNAQAYQMLQDVLDGKIPQPTVEEFLASLPEFAV